MRIFVALLLALSAASCGPALYSQNIGLAYRVKRGTGADDVRKIMGEPAVTRSIEGVDEWRYCATRHAVDEFAVIYFQNGFVIDRAFYTYHPAGEWGRQSCLENIAGIDHAKPPRRVLAARKSQGVK